MSIPGKDTAVLPDNVEILLVEDNEDDLHLAMRAFRLAKLTNNIHVVRDGQQALDFIFCEGPYAGRNIDHAPRLVLLDLKLPKIDGVEVLRRIKADPRTRTIPVVALTSSKQQRDVMETYHLGVNAYIVKPVDFEQFVEAAKHIGLFWMLLNQAPQVEGR